MDGVIKNNLSKFRFKGYEPRVATTMSNYLKTYLKNSAREFEKFNNKNGGHKYTASEFYESGYKLYAPYYPSKSGGRIVMPSEYYGKNSGRYGKAKVGGRIVMPSEYYGLDSGRYGDNIRIEKVGGGRRKGGRKFNISKNTFNRFVSESGLANSFTPQQQDAIRKHFQEDAGNVLEIVSVRVKSNKNNNNNDNNNNNVILSNAELLRALKM